MRFITYIVALFIVIFLVISILSIIFSPLADIAWIASQVLIGLGILLFIMGILNSLIRHSAMKIGALSRAEFYGVVIAMIGYMFMLNLRIDTIFTLLAQR